MTILSLHLRNCGTVSKIWSHHNEIDHIQILMPYMHIITYLTITTPQSYIYKVGLHNDYANSIIQYSTENTDALKSLWLHHCDVIKCGVVCR